MADWTEVTARYRTPDDAVAWRKLVACLAGLVGSWALMVVGSRPDAVLWPVVGGGIIGASLFMNQLFLYQHDMGHMAFFEGRRTNDVVGQLVCIFMLTPFLEWTRSHALHHKNLGKLDHRSLGDIYVMTLDEWRGAPSWKRGLYRMFRSVVTLLGIAPLWYFLVANRIKGSLCKDLPRGRNLVNLWVTTLGFAVYAALMGETLGWTRFILLQGAVLAVGGALGLFIFYLGHNFEHTWFARSPADWTHKEAALRGASFCTMPRWLGWFLADIGFHHVHHLDARVPCYRLRACHEENPALFGAVRPITLGEAVTSLWSLRLYDTEREELVSFADAR